MRTDDQATARENSLRFLAEHRVPFISHLPLIESRSELDPPTAERVARRALVLVDIIGVGFGSDRERVASHLRSAGLWLDLSRSELELFAKPVLTRQDRINATWRVECVQVLAWGLGLAELSHFQGCDDDLASRFPTPERDDPAPFLRGARLRPFAEIYQQCDLLYCLHWASRNALLGGEAVTYDEGIMSERHKAINWLAGVESEWDEVGTDT